MKKRILSMILAIVMVAGMLPAAAYAAETDNLCAHHTEHTADCGYAPAVEGSPCTHVHDDACGYAEPIEEVLCDCVAAEDGTLTHAEGCGYVEAVAGSDCTHVHDEACGYVEAAAEVPCGYVCEESHVEATRVIYVDESTFFASGYSHFYDANENLLTATREEQGDGWVKYTIPADAKYYLTFDGHMGGGGGGNYPVLPTNADSYDPFSDTWSCSHPGYAEGNCYLCGKPCPGHSYENGTCTLCGEPCPGHTYDNACDASCNNCDDIREVGDHVYDGAEDAECNECGYVRDITPAQITGVSITIDGVVYDSSNTSAEDPAVITPTSTVTLTVTGTSLHNGSDDHTVDYAYGLYLYVNPDYFEISEDGTVATYEPSAGDFANSSNFEITYCNNYTDTANRSVVPTGIYLTYDDEIAEEDKAEITGMSITIDGVVYDSSNTSAEDPAVITPNTEFITITVHGTALQNCTTDHVVSYYSGSSEPILPNSLWRFEADGTSAYHYYSSASALSDFARNTTPYELQYSNNGSFNAANPAIGSGVYIVYDDSTGSEEDTTPAEITGVTVTVDGVPYTSGNVTITPTSTITLTVTGTNLQNGTNDNRVNYADGFGQTVNRDYFEISEDGSTATCELSTADFVNSSNYEIKYYNNYTDIYNRTVVPTGIYLTYDDGTGGEEDTTPAEITGVSITVDGVTYTEGDVTITPTSTIIVTVTGTNFANLSAANILDLGPGLTVFMDTWRWETDSAANTATADFSDLNSEFGDHNAYEIMYSNDSNQNWTGTGIYLTYDDSTGEEGGDDPIEPDTTPAEITGVSITVDGETYTSGNVTITPTSTITLTVTGTNLQNGTDDNRVDYADGFGQTVSRDYFEISEDGSTATCELSTGGFTNSSNFEITYYNNYTDSDNRVMMNTGIYLTYDDSTGGEEDTTPAQITGVSITVDSVTFTKGDVTITPDTQSIIVTVTGTNFANLSADNILDLGPGLTIFMNTFRWKIDSAANTATADFSDLNSEFGDHNAYEIMYSNDSNQNWTGTGIYLTYDDSTGEEGGDDPIEPDTTPAEITGVSITVDGETYTSGNVTITPTSTITLTVTGTNLQNGTDDNRVDYADGVYQPVKPDYFEISEDGSTATSTLSAERFANSSNFEITYCNNDTDTDNRTAISTGIYLTYDDEVNTTLAIGDNEIADGYTYTYTAEQDGSLCITVTELYYRGIGEVNEENLGNWCAIEINGTAIIEFANSTEVKTGDTVTVELISLDNDTYNGTVNLSWDAPVMAEITGVSITIDGVEYVGSDTSAENPAVISSESASVILTVHGTNLQNATGDQWVSYMSTGNCVTLDNSDWTKSEDGSLASLDLTFLTENFTQSVSTWEIKYSNDGGGLEDAVTGLYVKYEHIPEEALWGTDGDNLTNGGTFAEAIAAAGADSDITYIRLGTDVTDDWGHEIESGVFTLDLNGHTLKADEFYALTLKNAGTVVTLTDTAGGGAAIGGHVFAAVLASDGAKALINGGSYSGLDAVSANSGGFIEINGGSFTGNGGFAVAVGESSNAEITGGSFSGAFCSVNSGGTTTITGGSFGVGEYGHFAYSAGMLDLSGYDQEKLNGLKLSYRTENELTVSGENIKLPEGYVFQDSEGNTVTTLTGYIIYTIGAAGTADEEEPIVITKQPTDGEAKLGERYCVEVLAEGEGLKYQWYFRNEGASNWNKSSVTDNTYDDVMTTARMNREVYCVITDASGNTVTTETAKLLAIKTADLAITTLPERVTVNYGERLTLTVEAVGDGVTYEWYYLDPDGAAWLSANVRSATYSATMSKKTDGRAVYCVATDIWGEMVATNVAMLSCERAELAITQQPANASAKLDEMFNVEVFAEGDGLKYQWYWRQIGSETWNVSGQRDNTYDDVMTSARHNREVYCVITDAWGNSLETDVATITGITEATLTITRQPANASAKLDEMFNVEVLAEGDGLKYQWYFKNSGTDTWCVSGQRDNSYDDVMTKARHDRSIYCVVTDAWGHTVTTETVIITAAPKHELAITAQPNDASAKLSENFCVTVEAQGDELRYQWYWRTKGQENWNVSGQRDNTYDDVMTSARHNREVYCVITDMWGKSAETEIALITGIPTATLAITQQPTDAEAALGETFCAGVEAQGDGLSYQWYFRNAGSSVWHKSGVTDNTYDDVMTKTRAGREVYCVITDAWGNTVTTETVTLIRTET